jgi:DNA-binding beta-propeller fold protein YncE
MSRSLDSTIDRFPRLSRRRFGQSCLAALGAICALPGCDEDEGGIPRIGELDLVWGRRGISDGRLQKPRAMGLDRQDRLYIVDMTARIQVFDTDGNFLHGWQTPDHKAGKPTGLSIDHDGRVLVADTHYYQLLVYSPEGEMLQQIGGTLGNRPGEFGLVTDAVQDSQGNLYISEYGEYDRIQKFAPDGAFLLQFGGHGSEPGQFLRPQNMGIDQEDRIWVADACNHRIQVFDVSGKLLTMWGEQGSEPGQLCYPYDLILDGDGNLYICEFGNHRIQKFTGDGRSLGVWGKEGRREGELFNPWAVEIDSQGRLHVLDTNNHRLQRVVLT